MYMQTRHFNAEEDDPVIDIVKRPGQHGHPAEMDLVATTALIEQMIHQVEADPTRPVKRIYDQVIIGYMKFV